MLSQSYQEQLAIQSQCNHKRRRHPWRKTSTQKCHQNHNMYQFDWILVQSHRSRHLQRLMSHLDQTNSQKHEHLAEVSTTSSRPGGGHTCAETKVQDFLLLKMSAGASVTTTIILSSLDMAHITVKSDWILWVNVKVYHLATYPVHSLLLFMYPWATRACHYKIILRFHFNRESLHH